MSAAASAELVDLGFVRENETSSYRFHRAKVRVRCKELQKQSMVSVVCMKAIRHEKQTPEWHATFIGKLSPQRVIMRGATEQLVYR